MDKSDILYIIAILILFIGGISWAKFQWDMCREAGLGFWYCVQHAG